MLKTDTGYIKVTCLSGKTVTERKMQEIHIATKL